MRVSIILALAVGAFGCSGEENETEVRSGALSRSVRGVPVAAEPRGPRDLQITSWPDLGMAGGEVTFEVHPIPVDASLDDLTFRLVADPCGGTLSQDGNRAVYHIPKSCRGGRFTIEVAVPRSGDELAKSFSFRVEGEESNTGSLMLWPEERASVISPI